MKKNEKIEVELCVIKYEKLTDGEYKQSTIFAE